jgi:hypothetical protein
MTTASITRFTAEWDVETHTSIGDGERMLVPSTMTDVPQKLTVRWVRSDDGWVIESIVIRGRPWLKSGGWGNERSLILDDIVDLPTEVKDAVELAAPIA